MIIIPYCYVKRGRVLGIKQVEKERKMKQERMSHGTNEKTEQIPIQREEFSFL